GLRGIMKNFRHQNEYSLAKSLMAEGHEVYTYNICFPKENVVKSEIIDDIIVKRIRSRKILQLDLLKNLIKDKKPDIVHITHLRNDLAFFIVNYFKIKKVKICFSPNGIFHDPFLVENRDDPFSHRINYDNLIFNFRTFIIRTIINRKLFRNLKNYFYHSIINKVDGIIAISNHEKQILKRIGVPERKITIIPHGVNEDFVNRVKNSNFKYKDLEILNKQVPKILYIGQLKFRKGFDLLIQIALLLKKKINDFLIIIITSNLENLDFLIKNINKYGLKNNFIIKFRVKEEIKLKFLEKSDVFVLPTRYEGFGIPIIEAMAMGCPIVSTKIPVIDEIITHGENGLLAELNNPIDFANKIYDLLKNQQLREKLIYNGIKIVKMKYTEKRLGKETLRFYKKIINNKI
ncbi:MAG: glycosyltransferase family 4 protein, partial [Candidatus Helarchaeota archaeon]